MLDLSCRNRGKAGKQLIPDGIYDSVVTDLRWADGYEPQEAYEITYELTSADGRVYRHREIFKTDERNKRTATFEDYLADNGIANLSEFNGKHEKLTIKRVKIGTREYANIVEREIINV